MGSAGGIPVRLATLLADSAWLYAALLLLGRLAGQGGSPLPWGLVLALLMLGMGAAAAVAAVANPARRATVQAAAGTVAAYLAAGAGAVAVRPGDPAVDLAWGLRLLRLEYGLPSVVGLALAAGAAFFLWHRALRIAADPHPAARLLNTFRCGLVVLPLALLFGLDRVEAPMLGFLVGLFLAAALAGLAAGRLSTGGATRPGRRPAATIGLTVLAVLAAGLAIGTAAGAFGEGAAWSAVDGLAAVAGALWGAILWLLKPVFHALGWLLAWLVELLQTDDPTAAPWRPAWENPIDWAALQRMVDGVSDYSYLLDHMQVPLIIAIVVASYLMLARAYRGFGDDDRWRPGGEREAIEGERDGVTALAWWLQTLTPAALMAGRRRRTGRRIPADAPAIASVFRLYFDLLEAAARHGFVFQPQRTPCEQVPPLQAALPQAPVAGITDRFNAACYGGQPTDPAMLARLRAALEAARAERRRAAKQRRQPVQRTGEK